MENRKALYKDKRSFNPRRTKTNRELLEANRCRQRMDRFHCTRNLSPSPVQCEKEKVNLNGIDEENVCNLAKIVCNSTNPEKSTRQAAFLRRFVEWKENKKMQKPVISKKPPFLTAVKSSTQTTDSSSLVPRGHHKGFRPPAVLKNSADNEKVEQNDKTEIKGRQSIYTVVATPSKKKWPDEKCSNKFPIAKKALPTNLPAIRRVHDKTVKENKKSFVKKSPANKSVANVGAVNLTKIEKYKSTTTAISDKPLLRNDLKPRVLKMSPPPSSKGTTVTGAIAKIRAVTQKCADNTKQTKKSPQKHSGARLAKILKAKQPLNNSKKANTSSLRIKGKKFVNLLNDHMVENLLIQTPYDFTKLKPFDKFVTSTKIKNSPQLFENGTLENGKRTSAAKRNIMQDVTSSTLVKESSQNSKKSNKENAPQNAITKCNFIRYSVSATANEQNDKEDNDIDNEEDKTEYTAGKEEKTPTKFGPEERPANYLSPFVSVARGKVSLKTEKEKRNSVYLQDTNQNVLHSVETRRTIEAVRYFRKQLQDEIDRLHRLCDMWDVYKKDNLDKIQNANAEDMINVTIGQTRLLTTKKFMQFKGLIDRCEAGATGIGVIEYDGSEKTKPITSVDLEGFWSMLGLQVDNLDKRFDNLNRWKLNNWNDPDEVKPMIKKNLTKIKKSNIAPIAKAKPNAALKQMMRKMQSEMRKNRNKSGVTNVDLLAQSNADEENDNTTIRKSENTTSSHRLSIAVKDRKYFSPAVTIISVLSPNRRTNKPRSSQSPTLIKHIQKFNDALDSVQSHCSLRKSAFLNENSRRMSRKLQSPAENIESTEPKKSLVSATEETSSKSSYNSPMATARKSILKTPGTAKSRLRNVIFNEKLRVKKINFLKNEDIDPFEANNTHEEDLPNSCEEEPQTNVNSQRTLTLRSRKVRCRPSCEIVIPH